MVLHYVKLVALLPIDAGANPEEAGLARVLGFGDGCRSYEFHMLHPVQRSMLDSLVEKFRLEFPVSPKGELPSAILKFRNGPSAINIAGLELMSRAFILKDDGAVPVPSCWSVQAVWRRW